MEKKRKSYPPNQTAFGRAWADRKLVADGRWTWVVEALFILICGGIGLDSAPDGASFWVRGLHGLAGATAPAAAVAIFMFVMDWICGAPRRQRDDARAALQPSNPDDIDARIARLRAWAVDGSNPPRDYFELLVSPAPLLAHGIDLFAVEDAIRKQKGWVTQVTRGRLRARLRMSTQETAERNKAVRVEATAVLSEWMIAAFVDRHAEERNIGQVVRYRLSEGGKAAVRRASST